MYEEVTGDAGECAARVADVVPLGRMASWELPREHPTPGATGTVYRWSAATLRFLRNEYNQ
jgi:hypothetical protein